MYQKVSHVIFDLDGLILDSESIYDNVISAITTQFGKPYTNELKIKLMGTPDPITAEIVIKEMKLPYSVEKFLEIYEPKVKDQLQHPNLMPGAKRLIEHLYNHKIPIAIATSSPKDCYDLKIQDHKELMSLFHHVVCGTSDPEVKNGKPAPDVFLTCASRFPDKPAPNQCLVFEDSPNGAKGAVVAGMQVVLVPDPIVSQQYRKPATLVIDSLTEFRPELFGLPNFV